MEFIVPGKGMYGGITLSDLQGNPLDISRFVEDFRYEQRPPEEDGTSSDTIVLGTKNLLYQVSGTFDNSIYSFYTAFEGELPSVRRLTFLPLSEEKRKLSDVKRFPRTFLPTGPLEIEVGILERLVGYDPSTYCHYSVVLQVL